MLLTNEELAFLEDIPEAPLQAILDPEVYYSLEVENAPVLFSDGAYAKKGDPIIRKAIDEAVEGRHIDLQPVATGPDITDAGEVYWVSFENENLRVTKDTAYEVLELLNPDEHYRLFTVVRKAVNEPLAQVTEEEGASDHRIKGKTIVSGDQVSSGIEQHMWEKGREYRTNVDPRRG